MGDQAERLKLLEAALAAVRAGVIVVDAEGRVVFANEGGQPLAERLAPAGSLADGQSPDASLRYPDGRVMPPDEAPLRRALRGEAVPDVVVILRGPDGADVDLGLVANPVRDEAGSVVGAIGVCHDLTGYRRAEEALQESEARFRAVFERAAIGIVLVDIRTGRTVATNGALQEMLGYTGEELRGMSYADVTHPEDVAEGEALNRELVEGKRDYYQREKRYVRKDGQVIWGRLTVSLIRSPGNEPRYAISMVEDITERKRIEQLREDYLSLVSHDLRNPLTTIMGQAQWLRRLLSQQGLERPAASVEAILTSARLMNSMIQDLVQSARLEGTRLDLRKEPTDLVQLVVGIAERVDPPRDRERIRVECPERVPPALADPDRIERAIVNLITNALKYSPPEAPVVVQVARNAHEAVVSVIDRGEGIPPEDVSRVFERFYRAETGRKADGLGLGLYIARLIVEAHDGRIWVESEVGRGSAFHCALPLA